MLGIFPFLKCVKYLEQLLRYVSQTFSNHHFDRRFIPFQLYLFINGLIFGTHSGYDSISP